MFRCQLLVGFLGLNLEFYFEVVLRGLGVILWLLLTILWEEASGVGLIVALLLLHILHIVVVLCFRLLDRVLRLPDGSSAHLVPALHSFRARAVHTPTLRLLAYLSQLVLFIEIKAGLTQRGKDRCLIMAKGAHIVRLFRGRHEFLKRFRLLCHFTCFLILTRQHMAVLVLIKIGGCPLLPLVEETIAINSVSHHLSGASCKVWAFLILTHLMDLRMAPCKFVFLIVYTKWGFSLFGLFLGSRLWEVHLRALRVFFH
jgi:hypothetical protein